jgi:hypothetical protein
MIKNIELFANTFEVSSLEAAMSRRLLYLLRAKGPVKVIDVNTEMARAAELSVKQGSRRETMQARFGLRKNQSGEVTLPQAFAVFKGHRIYLGGYQSVQYMEDCGILDMILKGKACGHFRVFKGRVYYRFAKDAATKREYCPECSPHPPLVTVEANFEDESDLASHLFCGAFEQSKLPFALKASSQSKITVKGRVMGPERLVELKELGALESVMLGRRCPMCLAKACRCPADEERTKEEGKAEESRSLESAFHTLSLSKSTQSASKAKVCKTSKLGQLNA